jgi:hypothetical protein
VVSPGHESIFTVWVFIVFGIGSIYISFRYRAVKTSLESIIMVWVLIVFELGTFYTA